MDPQRGDGPELREKLRPGAQLFGYGPRGGEPLLEGAGTTFDDVAQS